MTAFLPILSLIIGAIGIFYDFQNSTGWKKWGIGAVIFLILASICLLEILDNINSNEESKQAKDEIEELRRQFKKAEEQRNNASKERDELSLEINELGDEGLTLERKKAHQERRKKITVYYYKRNKDVDPPEIIDKLKQLDEEYGFKALEFRDCIKEYCDFETNAIHFGSQVTANDIKIVAGRLISSRIIIRLIRQFKEQQQRELHIQIGYDPQSYKCNLWQRKEIDSTLVFPRGQEDIGCPKNTQ